ncbi:MAG: methyltransferase domain-containing protein [Hyphomicrobiaceae bacterium]
MAYQDFDGKGDSKSHEKLKALRLDDFANVTGRCRERPLRGLSVLDIGCNEGFFCVEAKRQGASRVVGIDRSATFIEAARKRCPDAAFIQDDWWGVPAEKFDVILFLSAIHYETNQKELLAFLKSRLNLGGTLILECGVARHHQDHRWHVVERADGLKRYPTDSLLRQDLLAGYSVRWIGTSVSQAGDPIPRFVYHCRPKSSTALLISGPGGSGKSTLATEFRYRGIPVYSTDSLFERLLTDSSYAWSPIPSTIRERYRGDYRDWGSVAAFLVEAGMHDALSDLIASECPLEADLFCIEGDLLRHELVRSALIAKLKNSHVTAWNVAR